MHAVRYSLCYQGKTKAAVGILVCHKNANHDLDNRGRSLAAVIRGSPTSHTVRTPVAAAPGRSDTPPQALALVISGRLPPGAPTRKWAQMMIEATRAVAARAGR